MIESVAARCWLRVAGIAICGLAAIGGGTAAIAVSDAGWHELILGLVLMVVAAAAVLLVAGNVVLGHRDPARGRMLLSLGTRCAGAVVVVLMLLGTAVLLRGGDTGSDAWFTTWVTALPMTAMLVLGAVSTHDA
ncbi:MAG: hypothetical protein ACRCY8_18665, partial [Dermatophilaceae bacterium]